MIKYYSNKLKLRKNRRRLLKIKIPKIMGKYGDNWGENDENYYYTRFSKSERREFRKLRSFIRYFNRISVIQIKYSNMKAKTKKERLYNLTKLIDVLE